MSRTDIIADLGLHFRPDKRFDQLIAAHSDTAVNAPQRQRYLALAKGAMLGNGVMVVRVDERPVDVEERCFGHAPRYPPRQGGTRLG